VDVYCIKLASQEYDTKSCSLVSGFLVTFVLTSAVFEPAKLPSDT